MQAWKLVEPENPQEPKDGIAVYLPQEYGIQLIKDLVTQLNPNSPYPIMFVLLGDMKEDR